MKRLFKILAVVLMGILLSGKSCVDDSGRILWQEKQAGIARDSIREEFEADYLTEEARIVAEISAMHKLKDLSDYIKIISDRSMDTVFREKASEMIRDIFISGDALLSFGQTRNKKKQGPTLEEFLEKGFGNEIISAEIIFSDIRITEHLERNHQDDYAGKIGCEQTLRIFTHTDSIITNPQAVSVKIFSSKIDKVFGNDTLTVWKVFLGEMVPDPPQIPAK